MNLQKLISQREALKNVIEHYLTKIEAVKENFAIIEYNAILESIEAKIKQLETLNEKIVGQTDVEEIQDEILQIEMYMLDLDINVRNLREFRVQQESRNTQSTQLNVNANSFLPQNVSNIRLNSSQFHRLPKISLPTFNGDILRWQSFWDSFESTIHTNNNLTDVQKFTYLQSQIEGAAARTIDGFALTNANYLKAISLLKDRFGQLHKIIHATMQALIQLPAPCNTLISLRNFYDRMETYIRGLESMGQSNESYGSLLVPIILDKMPSEIRKNLARGHGDNNWQLEELRCMIGNEITIMEAGSQSHLPQVNDFVSTASFYAGASQNRQKQRKQHNRNRPVHESTEKRSDITICAFCEENHKSNDCAKFPDQQSRLQKVKEKQLCFNCLRKHQVAKCTSYRRCQICKKKHHTSICYSRNTEQRNESPEPEVQRSGPETAVFLSSTSGNTEGVLLKTAIGTVSSGRIQADANILFDEGAQKSFITEALAQELQLSRTGIESIQLATFGKQEEKLQHLDTATVQLITDRKEKIPIRVLIVPTIATPMNSNLQRTANQLCYLKGLTLAHPVTGDQTFTISMLIGADHYWHIVEDHVIRGNGPTAVKSKIGYLLSGPVTADNNIGTKSSKHIFNVITSHVRDDAAIERFWTLESMGIIPDAEQQKTEYLADYQQTSIEFADEKYTAALPWKSDHEELPSNYDITKTRTKNTIRRLSRSPDLLQKYSDIILEQERRGFIEKVDESVPTSGTVHYIPHHPVRKESSTTPIRIVYDCSCRQSHDKPSLNDCLESTAPVLNELTSILMRFRLNRYAVATDIEKAFLHIGLKERDRNFTRFLWLSEPCNPDSPLCTYRFKAVLFGATCSPFILNATILKHLELNKSNKAAEILKRDLYVDNVLSSFQQQTDLLTYFKDARDLMTRASMNLRSWTSNSRALREIAATEGVIDKDEETKVLGLRWKPEADTLTFVHRDIPALKTVTKRDILKYSSRIYDPLGLLSPVTVRAKLLLQQLWKDKYDWDVPLPAEIQGTWTQLANDLNSVTNIDFSRLYIRETESNTKPDTCLHIFVDASMKSYGAAAYICNKTQARLVMAKNRVAPLKPMTLPQLELMAAVVGARLASNVQQALCISTITCWSDSQIILHWLSTSKPLRRFVRNRVQEIQSFTGNHQWLYCPTRDNPADLLTRGIPADQLRNNSLWNVGPPWITRESEWPIWKSNNKQTTVNQQTIETEELLPSNVVQQHALVASLQDSPNENIQQIIDTNKYSTYFKLLRVTAYVLRFIDNCKYPQAKMTDVLTVAELETAERKWLKSCQETAYQNEMTSLKSKAVTRLPIVKQLRLFLDNYGIIRCGGRIHNAPLPDVAKFPYLLPKRHPLTRLIILETHENQLHAGINATTTQIRQKYWIPTIRQCVKSVIRKCTLCARVQGKPYRAPDPPPLPKIRVEQSPPFTVTGIDYTGALYVRDPTGGETKSYICLFTCASTRAVHLEIVRDLSQESFIQAFRRFSSRRSLPKIIMSDNATTFVGAAQLLKRLFESASVKEVLSRKGTEWHFIPKRAPWYGGWWERLIGLTKNTLKKVLGRSIVTMETLQTVVTEIEAMLNDRPLTSMTSDNDDLEPLTPSHLLYGRRLTSLPYNTIAVDLNRSSIQDEHSAFAKRTKLQSTILNQFWKRWKMEYLTALRETHRKSGTNTQTITVGDVVQIHDECPRNRWKLGVVEEFITGRDNLTRAAKVRTSNGNTTRPIVRLYPLEAFRDSDTRM